MLLVVQSYWDDRAYPQVSANGNTAIMVTFGVYLYGLVGVALTEHLRIRLGVGDRSLSY